MSSAGKKSSCLGMLVGNIILGLMIYTPVYFIFFDDVEDLVEDYSFQDVLFVSSVDPFDTEEEIERKSDFLENFVDAYEMRTGIDLSIPIYKAAKNNKNFKSVEINYIPLANSKVFDFVMDMI